LEVLRSGSFRWRAAAALAVSVAADALDYAGAPLFATPVIGDIADGIIMAGGLSAITRSKRSTLINAIEFVPVIGDFVPIYTISTLLWIFSEFKKRRALFSDLQQQSFAVS
jgi:hypothetical protein